jgi:carboxyl-terminal processing protease
LPPNDIGDIATRIHDEYIMPMSYGQIFARALRGAATAPDLDDAARASLRAAAERLGDDASLASAETLTGAALQATQLPLASLYGPAVSGMVDGLDPLTSYMNPTAFRAMQRQTRSGIGAEVIRRGDNLVVLRPLAGGPAAVAGLRSGDVLLKLDDHLIQGAKLDEARALLAGPAGSVITVAVHRPGQIEPLSIVVNRADVYLAPVVHARVGAIGVIAIGSFNELVVPALRRAITELRRDPGLRGWVLDLRGSPGGLLDAAEQIAQTFLPWGSQVMSVEARQKAESPKITARQDGVAKDLPLVVVVDHETGAGAEIVAGALQDDHRAIVFGARTSGLGTIQTIMPLTEPMGHGALRLTTARVRLPSGRLLAPDGITPDVLLGRRNVKNCTKVPCDLPQRLQAITADPEPAGDWPDPFIAAVAAAMER